MIDMCALSTLPAYALFVGSDDVGACIPGTTVIRFPCSSFYSAQDLPICRPGPDSTMMVRMPMTLFYRIADCHAHAVGRFTSKRRIDLRTRAARPPLVA